VGLVSALAQYKRHARKFGPEGVYETACFDRDLTPLELAYLVEYLRGLPPHKVLEDGRLVEREPWSRCALTRNEKHALVFKLAAVGQPDGFIARALRMDRRTIAEVLAGGVATERARRVRTTQPGPWAADVERPKTAKTPLCQAKSGWRKKTSGVTACPECGALFVQAPGAGRPRRFCSDECRRQAWNDQRRQAA
jgi:hypothetical protein